MIGPKLFILFFLAFTADAQNRRPPPRRPLSNGPLGRPVPIGSVSIPKPSSVTPGKIKLELPNLNDTKLIESTPNPDLIIVYPEESLPDSFDNLFPNDIPKPLPDPAVQPDEADSTTRYTIIDPEELGPEPKTYPDPEPQPEESDYTTRYPAIDPEGLEPEPTSYPDPEPQPDEPDFTTRYPISDPDGLEPEPNPYNPEPQPDEPDYTTRYPVVDPDGLEPTPKPYPDPEPQPDEPDYTTRYPINDPTEIEPESSPYPEPETQPDEPEFTTRYPISDPDGLEPEPNPYPNPKPQPDEPDYTTRYPVVDPDGLEPTPKPYPNLESQPDEPDYTTRYPVVDPDGLEPTPKPYPDPETQPDEPDFTTRDPNIGDEGLNPETKPDPDPKPHLPDWKPPIPTLPPLKPHIPPYYPYPSKPIAGYTCRHAHAYYAVPWECNAYVECRKSIARKYECPDGFHFSPGVEWPEDPCVHSSQVKCENNTSINWPKPLGECPQRFGSFPSTTGDCGKYIVCDEGRAHFMTCPNGLAFNPIISGCDWPEQVPGCKPSVFKDFTCPLPSMNQYYQPVDHVTHYSYGNSCKEYIACLRGEPRLLRCDSGLHFDPITRRCIDANKVKNCGTRYSRTYYRRLKQGTL